MTCKIAPKLRIRKNMSEAYKAKLRVAVFKDVLKRLRYRNHDGFPGYVIGLENHITKNTKDLKEIVSVLEKNCDVCMKGTILLSKARLLNHVPITDNMMNAGGVDDCDVCDALEDIFDTKNLDLMEIAFEGWYKKHYPHSCYGSDTIEEERAYEFTRFILLKADRVKAVCKNGIANNGTFCP